jgi:hypothetical protein
MGFHATINGRPAPRVNASKRVTPGDQQRKADMLAGPVTVTKVKPAAKPRSNAAKAAVIATRRDGHLRQGVTTSGSRNGQTAWAKVAHTTDNYMITVRKPGAAHDAVIVVKPQTVKGTRVWVALMRIGQGPVKPIGYLTRDRAFDPTKISQEIRDAALMQVKRHGWEAI